MQANNEDDLYRWVSGLQAMAAEAAEDAEPLDARARAASLTAATAAAGDGAKKKGGRFSFSLTGTKK